MPKVSIIVPIYNMEKYLEKCINSIINQTLKDIEIILVNDGSNDRSGNIADEFAKLDPRIKVIHKENEGQGIARNIGIDVSKGEYIGFVDSDDWIDINMYEELYSAAKNNFADISVCGRKLYDKYGKIESQISINNEVFENVYQNITDYCINNLFYPHTVVVYNKIYKRDIININNIRFNSVDKIGSEDALFNYQILFHVNKIISTDKTYYNQFAREGSTARQYKSGMMSRTAVLIEEMYKYAENLGRDNINNELNPIILVFFQQWNYSMIKKYCGKNIKDILIREHKNKDNKYFKLIEKNLIFSKEASKNLFRMGYSKRGIFFIKMYMLFDFLGWSRVATRIRMII